MEPRDPDRDMNTSQGNDPQGRVSQRPSVLRDALNGVVRGDYAPKLGLAGTLAQAAIGYVPVLGTAAAARDLAASWRKGQRLDAALNALALIPVAGGIAKTAEAAHTALRLKRAFFGPRRSDRMA
jgi:hypothetical protein